VGCKAHRVGIARPDGSILEEFDISYNDVGFQEFFRHVEAHRHQLALAVAAAMERRLRGQALFFDVNSHTPAHARSCPEAIVFSNPLWEIGVRSCLGDWGQILPIDIEPHPASLTARHKI
jgi:hypothetical protein